MSAEELALLHPQLFHITTASAIPSIKKHGLLAAAHLELLKAPEQRRDILDRHCCQTSMRFGYRNALSASDADQMHHGGSPQARLARKARLSDWTRALDNRVYFWVNEANMRRHVNACTKDGGDHVVLVFDTLSLVKWNLKQVELSPINSGSTVLRSSWSKERLFTPVQSLSYRAWQRRRGGRDHIKELAVLGGVRDIELHLTESHLVPGRPRDELLRDPVS